MSKKMRLQVALARAGVASRRKSAELIAQGRVSVNGKSVTEKGFLVDISKDRIAFDENAVSFEKKLYYILNKPRNVISAVRDNRQRETVSDYAKNLDARLYPIGRLDLDTTGLIILTNDGELTYRLTHPKFGVERLYEVTLERPLKENDVSRLKNGVMVEGRIAQAKKVILEGAKEPRIVLIAIREGRKREVRRMFKAIGHKIVSLRRTAYGPLNLGGLKEGKIRPLTDKEISELRKSVGL